MGLNYNSTIVKDGLVLHYDAANSKSYGGSAIVEVLVVAGGGGGGMDMGGGGGMRGDGAGPQPNAHAFTISATSGGNSSFGSYITAIGGGYGTGSYVFYTPNIVGGIKTAGAGGSGGGMTGYIGNGPITVGGGAGTLGQGFNGGQGQQYYYSGGGGGAGAPGTNAPGTPHGGIGKLSDINGTALYWGGGGGAASYSLANGGNGGNGGGGGGAVGTTIGGAGLNAGSAGGGGANASQCNTPGGNAGANTGGGGGGGSHYNLTNAGGNGGSGIVIVRYLGPQNATGGTVTTSGAYTVHTFTSSGTFTPTSPWLNMYDLSKTNNTGALYGPTFSSSNAGNLGFDGTNDYILTPLVGSYDRITFEFWGYYDDPTLNTLSRDESAFGEWPGSSSNYMHFGTRWNGVSAGMHWNVNQVWQTTPTTNLRYEWNHYCLTWNVPANQKLVYLNGILSSTNTTAGGNIVMTGLRIGVATNLNAYYQGKIGSFKVYNRVLSLDEIKQNMNALRGRFGL